ncbi:MAG TPA: 4Fe-4S binding protein [Kofleriaceae bacterium]|nr:4Fe-4S binding protein [Kofleriaceae bacterium]
MLNRLRERVPEWLRTARWHAADLAWHANWRAIRAAATPWARPHFEAARAKLFGDRAGAGRIEPVAEPAAEPVLERDLLDGWLRDAAPPDVPFDAVVLETAELRKRFGDGPRERRSLHMHGKLRMTHRGIPTRSVLVLALYSDVAADYFVESMAADVAARINGKYGKGIAFADTQASVPVLLKEVATAAGLGKIGKNALFFSRRFGFNCKLNVVFLNAAVNRYDAPPLDERWKLPDCTGCNLCVEACPVGAFDDFVITRTESCDRLIAGDFFGPRRDHMCRACITRCPVSNDVLKLRRSEGAPRRVFWDNEAQMSLVADLFMYRPSFLVWVLQRFYYGSELPGRVVDKKKGYTDSLSAAMNVTTSEETRDGWRLAARRRR